MAACADAATVSGTSGISRKRFTVDDDLCVLRDVLSENPFENPKRWAAITEVVNAVSQRGFTVRAVKERVDLLVALFKKDDREKLKKSGTEEQYTEKVRLLHDIVEMQRDFAPRRVPRLSSAQAAAARDEATATMLTDQHSRSQECRQLLCMISSEEVPEKENDEPDLVLSSTVPSPLGMENMDMASSSTQSQSVAHTPVRTDRVGRKRKSSAGLEFLAQRNASDRALKERQLHLEERRAHLEEERLAFQKWKYETEAALEKQRFEAKLEVERRRLELDEKQEVERLRMEAADREARREVELKQANVMQFLLEELLKRK